MNRHYPLGYRVFRQVTIWVLVAFVSIPLYVMVTTALKPLEDVNDKFTWIPSVVTVQPFLDIWTTVPLARYFLNSVVVSVISTVFSVLIATLAAYAVSRWRFHGKETFRIAVLSTQMFPGIMFLLPIYLIFIFVGQAIHVALIGSLLGLIITYLTFALPFSIWMLIGYFESIPRELDEAAKVDGAGAVRTLLQVIVPTAVPGIVSVAIFAFMTAWGEILFASVLTTEKTRTLSIGLEAYATEYNVYWNQVMAASLVVSVPVVVGFLLLQKYFVAGFTAGAVK